MRTRDINPNEIYATGEGKPVQIMRGEDGELHTHWVRTRTPLSGGGYETNIEDARTKRPAPDDPWASQKMKPKAKAVVGKRGLYVKIFDYDANGDIYDEPIGEAVMQPKDIAGLWNDFVTLHPDVVRERATKREREAGLKNFQAALKRVNGRLSSYGIELQANVKWSGTNSQNMRYALEGVVTFKNVLHAPDKESFDAEEHWYAIERAVRRAVTDFGKLDEMWAEVCAEENAPLLEGE